MLYEMFGMEWYKVHDEAERLEHAVSRDFEAKLLARKLGRGGACPHGNLSEWKARSRRRRGLLLLSEAEAGKRYRVRASTSATASCWNFWKHRGIRPGADLALDVRNYDKTLSLRTSAGTWCRRPPPRRRFGFLRFAPPTV